MIKKIVCFLAAICLLGSLCLPAAASEMGKLESYGVDLIQYYLHHQEKAADVVWDITRQMKQLDPKQGAVWEKLMFDWSWINTDMPIYEKALPEGLPQDDSLCIAVMGFGLNEDGSLRPELEDRLVVALTSALNYPNAWVLVTGGQTGALDGVTEAGQMAAWLQEKGLEPGRIIQENQSLSTTANAVNSYKLLTKSYPQVTSIGLVTSDYHIRQSCAMFAAVSNYQSGYKGGKSLELVGNAVCRTGQKEDSLLTQAWGISLIFGLPFEENTKAPELYPVEIPVETYVEPTAAEETEPDLQQVPAEPAKEDAAQEQETAEKWILPAACVAAAALVIGILAPRKPRKKNKRQRPKMNWDV